MRHEEKLTLGAVASYGLRVCSTRNSKLETRNRARSALRILCTSAVMIALLVGAVWAQEEKKPPKDMETVLELLPCLTSIVV